MVVNNRSSDAIIPMHRSSLSGAQLSALKKWQIGSWTTEPRGPVVLGPTVRPEKVADLKENRQNSIKEIYNKYKKNYICEATLVLP